MKRVEREIATVNKLEVELVEVDVLIAEVEAKSGITRSRKYRSNIYQL